MTATALVRIVEGEVSADLLKKELARILPEKWEWVVTEHGKKEFIVPFPSKVELDMLTAIKRVPTDNNEGLLYFEEWSEEIKPNKKLPKVWVHIYGVPHEIRSFLPLWAIGSILGATLKVDMNHLRNTGVVRLLVAVLDPDNIPDETDIVINKPDGSYMYPIYFKLEEIIKDSDPDNLDDDDLLGDDEAQQEDQEMRDINNDENKGEEQATGDQHGEQHSSSSAKDHSQKTNSLSPVVTDPVQANIVETSGDVVVPQAEFSVVTCGTWAALDETEKPGGQTDGKVQVEAQETTVCHVEACASTVIAEDVVGTPVLHDPELVVGVDVVGTTAVLCDSQVADAANSAASTMLGEAETTPVAFAPAKILCMLDAEGVIAEDDEGDLGIAESSLLTDASPVSSAWSIPPSGEAVLNTQVSEAVAAAGARTGGMAGLSDKAPAAGLELASGGEELGAVEAELRAIKVAAIASAVPIPLPPVEGKMKVK